MALFVLLPLVLNPFFLPTADLYCEAKVKEDAGLTERFAHWAALTLVKPPKVCLLSGRFGRSNITAMVHLRKVYVTTAMWHAMSETEIDFALAHEIAHLERTDQQLNRLRSPWAMSLSVLFVTAFLFAVAWSKVAGPFALHVGPMIVLMGVMVVIVKIVKPVNEPGIKLEIACDRRALELTRDLPSAVSSLEKIGHPESRQDVLLSGYPTRDQRISALRSAAAELGLVDPIEPIV